MLHPSYSELMHTINKDAPEDQPVVSSRYSIVMAASKRARQLITRSTPDDWRKGKKPLTKAIEELSGSTIKILGVGQQEDVTETAPETTESEE